jgi:uncharacterized membrane protein HdeD (DUF308 family)
MMTEPQNNPEMVALVEVAMFPWWIVLLWGILLLIFGLMFLFTPVKTVELLIMFIGAYWLVGGCFSIGSLVVDKNHRGWKIFLAAINILAGLVILGYPLYSTVFLLAFFIIFIGFWGLFIGSAHLYQAYVKKDAGMGILGVISLIFGVMLLAYPLIAASLIPLIIGVFAVASGIAAIIASFGAKKLQCCQPA